MLEAKGVGYSRLLKDANKAEDILQRAVTQAKRQLNAAKGTKIQWHIAEADVAEKVRARFLKEGNGLENIEIIHTAMDWSK